MKHPVRKLICAVLVAVILLVPAWLSLQSAARASVREKEADRNVNRLKGLSKGVPETNVPAVSMTVDSISLFRSDRGKNGMIYTEIGSVSATEKSQEEHDGLRA